MTMGSTARGLWAVIVAIDLVVCLAAWEFMSERRDHALTAMRLTAVNRAEVLAESIGHEYEKVALALVNLTEDQAYFRAQGSAVFEAWLGRIRARHQELSFLRLTDAGGEVIYAPDMVGKFRANVSDRPYFIRLRDEPAAGLQITGPIIGRTSGRHVIVLARRMNDAQGQFAGVAIASVALDYFQQKIARLPIGPHDSMTLRDAEARLIAWHPQTPGTFEAGRVYLSERLRAALQAAPEAGHYESGAESAGQEARLYAYRRHRDFGFLVSAGVARDDALAAWETDTRAAVLAVLAFVLASMLLGAYLSRIWRREAADRQAIVERDHLLREAQRLGAIGSFVYEFAGDRVRATPEFESLAGIDADHPHTLEGCLALIHPEDRPAIESSLRQGVAEGRHEVGGTFRILRPRDGGLRHLGGRALVERDPSGRPLRLIGMIQDQTDQVLAREELRSSEARFRAFFDNAMVGMAVTSPEKGWVMVNPAMCQFFGLSREELMARTWAQLTHPDDLAADARQFERVLAGEIDGYELEKRFVLDDGRVVDAYIAARAVRRADRSVDFFSAIVMDISQRKAAENSLRRSLDLLAAAGSIARFGGWELQLPSMLLTWTDETYRIHEMTPGTPVTVEQSIGFYAPESRPLIAAAVRRAIDSGTPWDLDLELVTANGRRIWTRAVGKAEVSDGRAVRLHGAFFDITERKNFEHQLLASREMLRQFLDHLPGTAYVKDGESRVLMANRGFLVHFGMDPQAMIGRCSEDLFPGDIGRKMVADDRRVIASGDTEVIEEEYAGRFYESTKFCIDQQGLRHLGGITLDVTARVRSRRRGEALLTLGSQSGLLDEQAYLRLGLELAESITGSRIAFLHFVNEDQESIELKTWTANALKGCQAAYDNHYPISSAGIWADCFRRKGPVVFNDYASAEGRRGLPDGHAPLIRLISVPVIEEGRVRVMMGVGNKADDYDDFDVQSVQLIGNDLWRVVRRMRLEAQVRSELAKSRVLNHKLEQAHSQLLQSEKMAAIGQLAAGVAHELNNPIGFIQSNLGTLQGYVNDLLEVLEISESCAAGFEEAERRERFRSACKLRDVDFIKTDIRQLLAESKEGADRVRKIVQNLKDFAHVSDDEWAWTDLHQGLDSTLSIVWNEIKYKAEVDKRYATLPPVRCMPGQVNQVFMNLLVNAAQAIEERGHIVIATGCEGERVWVTISDDGTGIAPDNLDRIFEPFFTTKPVGKGTGLGLSLAWGIVDKHHGRLSVESTPGVGTTFRVELPIDGSSAGALEP